MSIFSKVQNTHVNSNTFDLSHQRKMSMDMGTLTPILVMDTIPGDKFRITTSQLLRFAPLVAPMMHQVSIYTHFFFVPNRILWDNWETFITGGEDGADVSVAPYIGFTGDMAPLGSLPDYMGLPNTDVDSGQHNINALSFAAYQACYNEYYRDQNLITAVDYDLDDGDNTQNTDLTVLRRRAWQHDYFTSALPFTQKGVEATIPIGTTGDVTLTDPSHMFGAGPAPTDLRVDHSGPESNSFPLQAFTGTSFGANPSGTWQDATLSPTTATSINDLRNAFRLQEWLEKNARGGSRYIESILSHFGVRSSDARLQRPEFLGGASTPLTISEVLQTSGTDQEPTPQGNMAGHAISLGANRNITYRCEEHGYIIGIMSVMPKTAYQQGIPKHFRKFDKFDYFWPEFAHLGEQPIINEEIFFNNMPTDDDTFGYTPRYAEYKYMNDSVHGEFRASLDFWHMGRVFDNQPQLNQEFIECVPTERIFAVQSGEKIYAQIHHSIKASRKMPFFGTPTF